MHLTARHSQSHERVQEDKAPTVAQILGERTTSRRQTAAKDACCMLITFARSISLREKEAIHIQKIGSCFGQGYSFDTMGQAANAIRERSERESLSQHGQTFLGDGRRGRTFAQKCADRLALP